MSAAGAAIFGGSVLLSGTGIATALIVRRAVSEAASSVRDGAWRGYTASLSLTVRPPAAKAPKAAEAAADPAARARENRHAPDEPVMTRTEAADLLGVSHMTVRRLGAKEVLDERPCAGRATLVTTASVHRYQASLNGTGKDAE